MFPNQVTEQEVTEPLKALLAKQQEKDKPPKKKPFICPKCGSTNMSYKEIHPDCFAGMNDARLDRQEEART